MAFRLRAGMKFWSVRVWAENYLYCLQVETSQFIREVAGIRAT